MNILWCENYSVRERERCQCEPLHQYPSVPSHSLDVSVSHCNNNNTDRILQITCKTDPHNSTSFIQFSRLLELFWFLSSNNRTKWNIWENQKFHGTFLKELPHFSALRLDCILQKFEMIVLFLDHFVPSKMLSMNNKYSGQFSTDTNNIQHWDIENI